MLRNIISPFSIAIANFINKFTQTNIFRDEHRSSRSTLSTYLIQMVHAASVALYYQRKLKLTIMHSITLKIIRCFLHKQVYKIQTLHKLEGDD